MLKIAWLELMGTWTIFGFYSAIIVENGGTGKIIGRKLCWNWSKWDAQYTPNIFRVYDRAKAIKNYGSPKEISK